MRTARVIAVMVTLVLGLTSLSLAASDKNKPARPAKVKSYKAGDQFCPSAALVVGNIVIQSGRCYVLFVLRDEHGTFLAFAHPAAKIPPGLLVRLNTPAGPKLKGRIFYLVPIKTTSAIVPMHSAMMIAVKTEDSGPRLSLTVVGTPAPNLAVIFSVRL